MDHPQEPVYLDLKNELSASIRKLQGIETTLTHLIDGQEPAVKRHASGSFPHEITEIEIFDKSEDLFEDIEISLK